MARTAWYVLFVALLKERAPPGFEVRAEVPVSNEPQRVDVLLLRRLNEPRHDDQARVLKALWRRIEQDAIVEFKSISRPVRRGDVARLLGYGAQYFASPITRLRDASQLALVLVVPSVTPNIEA